MQISSSVAILLFRLLRFTIGLLFLFWGYCGMKKNEDGSTILLIVGVVFFITGFFKPKRCIQDNGSN